MKIFTIVFKSGFTVKGSPHAIVTKLRKTSLQEYQLPNWQYRFNFSKRYNRLGMSKMCWLTDSAFVRSLIKTSLVKTFTWEEVRNGR